MKKLILGAAFFGLFGLASAQSISFDNETVDYGTIEQNADGNRFFTVTNTGDKPLILSNVQPSCGCTVPEWDKSPIAPGKSTKIKVHYNTATPGSFLKNVDVFSNDPERSRVSVHIKGNVQPAAQVNTASVAPVKAEVAPAKAPVKQATKKKNAKKVAHR